MKILEIKNRTPFPLKAGRKLRALVPLTLSVPVQILDGTKPLSELVKLTRDDIEVGVIRLPSGAIGAMIFALQPGDEFSLGRSSEIAVEDVPDGKAAFEELD